jgi:hypothetical protein
MRVIYIEVLLICSTKIDLIGCKGKAYSASVEDIDPSCRTSGILLRCTQLPPVGKAENYAKESISKSFRTE